MFKSICQVCLKDFLPKSGSKGKACSSTCGKILATINRKKTFELKKLKKEKDFLKKCKKCNSDIPYSKKYNIFCSKSCAATFNNTHSSPDRKRGPEKKIKNSTNSQKPKKIKSQIKKVSSKKSIPKKKRQKDDICGEYCKLYKCKCHKCHSNFINKSPRKYCKKHENMYKNARLKYKFSFNIWDYPLLFDVSLIEKYGWYSPGNKGPKNINGISRDHKISVTEAIQNNYDPYYISHPLNCELMRHNDNKAKYTNSSISYNELVEQIIEYEMAEGCGTDPHPFSRTSNLANCD